MKKLLCLALVILMLAVCALGENLVDNADFSELDSARLPVAWNTSEWNGSNTQYGVDDGAVMIYNFEANDARWVQTVKVKPRTGYLFTCLVKAENCDEYGRGANISILNAGAYSDSVFDTDGEWERVELYGITGSDQTEVEICLRVGGYSADGTGKAWFKDISFTESDIPEDVMPQSFATYAPVQVEEADPYEYDGTLPDRNTETWVLMAFIFLLAGCAAIMGVKRMGKDDLAENRTANICAFAGVMAAAFIIRTYVAFKTHGYAVDINCFMCWSERVADRGFNLYADGYFCDYPPLYMLMLGLISFVRRILGITYGSQAHIFLIKLFPMLADMLSSAGVYFLYRKKAGHTRALILACVVAFSPALIADSAGWGQTDSLLALFLCVCVYFAMQSKWQFALPVYALALLTKPQALLFGPIGLIACVIDVVKNRKLIKSALIGLGVSLACIYVISMPFALAVTLQEGLSGLGELLICPFTWIFDKLLGATGGYKYITVNACNLYTLLNKNWNGITGFWGVFAWIMFGVSYIYSAGLYLAKRDTKAIALCGALLMTMLFVFAPMMHERYLFPALLLTVLAYIEYRDERLLWFLAVVTVTQFINILLPLTWGQVVGSDNPNLGHLQSSEQTLNALVSFVNIAAAMFMMYTAFDIAALGHIMELTPAGEGRKRLLITAQAKTDYKMHLKRFDLIAMAGVTAAYSIFAFINLGTTSSPESYLKTTDYREEIVFDLGEVRTYRLTYHGGIADCAFTVALSNDGENWTEENYAEYSAGDMYRWLWYVPKNYTSGSFTNAIGNRNTRIPDGAAGVTYATSNQSYPTQTSRYVRFTVMGVGLVLNEVGFIDTENDCLYEVKSVTGSVEGTDYTKLIDEQDTVALVPSYLNGMYFDEIYHARTAYELLNGYDSNHILEWSHPHLGKLLIAVGIDIFGMNPFGWRCMGTLFGAMMLPLMYLLIKQTTGRSNLSLIGMLLLTFDSMHFTQSRIATVDVYAVFFIMLMYLFMIRYYKMNLHKEKLSRTFIPLGLSGVSMGLGICSKWICIYAAAGLAVIFFISIFTRFREYLYIRRAEPGNAIVNEFPKKLLLTAVFCVIMFIVLPLVMYYYSYYWHFRTSGGLSIDKVWSLQQQMFYYHAGLGSDTHFFRSPWYEWPLIVKPMWYYSADIAYTGYGKVSSISCMGNPAVWWTGLVSLICMLIALVAKKKPGKAMLLTAIGFASQFLPWVLVPRSTFIYHYFASVPFIIMATVIMLEELSTISEKLAKYIAYAVTAAAFILFAMFYPLESGLICHYDYAMCLRWFNWYNFALQ